MTVKILIGDVREKLKELPDESVHCVVTSPPYWGLRDYGTPGQLGLEPTLAEHVETMASIFDEVWRVLRKDGTCWVNYGDSYGASINGNAAESYKGKDDRTFRDKPFSTVGGVIKPKDLCGVPWRVAFALQERGWYLRQDIIWHKPNPMPESIRDRCTKAHEYVFLLSKSRKYYFDAEAIAELAVTTDDRRPYGSPGANAIDPRGKQGEGKKRTKIPGGWDTGAGAHGTIHRDGRTSAQYQTTDADMTRNRRSVWTIATAPFSEAHFATFPPELPELCIKAGTSQKGCCAACGAPWVREVERERTRDGEPLGGSYHGSETDGTQQRIGATGVGHWRDRTTTTTLGWSLSCQCNAAIVPATVLDIFGGAGTTGMVADRLQRNAILIELNPTYAAMAEKRISSDRGGLLDLMEAAE